MGNTGKRASRVWGNGCVPLGTPGTTRHAVATTGLVGLTSGQRFVVVLVLAGFVVELFVWPVIKRSHRNETMDERRASARRLKRELRNHE